MTPQDFAVRYARLLLAMSLDQAKEVLGFPPSAHPSTEEVARAYKAKAFENHPDRGGDPTKMVEINVARDILTGKGKPDFQPRYERTAPKKNPVPDTVLEGQTFEEAWSKDGPPANVDWKFVSAPTHWYEVSYYPGHRVWTLYGQTDTKHIFCAVKERGESAGVIPTDKGQTKIMEDWQVSWIDAPLSQDIARIASKSIKMVSTGWVDAKPKAPIKFIAWRGGKPTDTILRKVPYGGGASLKEILLGTGVLQDGDPTTLGVKTNVEMFAIRKKTRSGKYNYDVFVRINGKEELLAEDTIDALRKKYFIPGAFEMVEGRARSISKLRGGVLKYNASQALEVLAESLTTEPAWLHTAISRAATEHAMKTAYDITASVTHKYLALTANDNFKVAANSVAEATFKKLRDGSWGLLVNSDNVGPGDSVLTVTKSGQRSYKTIGEVVWSGNGVTICTISDAPAKAPVQDKPKSNGPTEKQVDYAMKLLRRLGQHGWHDSEMGQGMSMPNRSELENMTGREISEFINSLKNEY